MNEKHWVWIGLGAAAVIGALYVSGVIGPQQPPQGLTEATPVAESAAPEPQVSAADTDNTAAQPAEITAASGDAAPETTADATSVTPDDTASSDAAVAETTAEGTTADPEETEVALLAPDEAAHGTAQGDDPASDTAAAAPVTAAPSFDLVRAEPGGLITVAGRAEPGTEVTLLLDGEEELTSRAGSDGRFAAFFDLPASGEAQVLRLRMMLNGEAVESEQEVILTPPVAAANQVAEGETPEGAAEGAAETELASVEPAVTAAPTVLLSDADGVEVMQSSAPMEPGNVAIDAITYDETGGVALSGRGRGDAMLQVYLDNSPITTLKVAGDGRWKVALPGVEAGTYTLRVDQVDDSGEVTARAESPFRREPVEKLAAASEVLTEAEEVTAITVQPGNTLWAIARERYGDGLAYVRLFEANKTQIRDPNLIYPGQIFDFPD
ncbi:LysM peptidoglycan-binding domain-containing protein [Salipiger sp. PrR002]|uniref:LysM peptidoglycan-binding domain-containing protein n=1 Tax=Salipiger sp. PrR002 TaxID=2706489 RepID=UPI0013B99846|nr:LysM peptidoglycan-binding domain-containing protein [Salipiger sp. PrR002]NDV98066.1 LysM peptidoglycan-binding domain-containing protein [Salipiger sp. PrR002]NDW57041.1 LysM peptidoglycan-binding domain-containing protein [Salipiger sp. PrR004]